jgi:16S rRNA (cytosine1402-N4)-methyltransferase
MANAHAPVMLAEVCAEVQALGSASLVVDATFGRGGHTRALLACLGPAASVLGIDQDDAAVRAGEALAAADGRFTMVHASFADLAQVCARHALAGRVDVVVLDLGVSSPQIDDAARGFSFLADGPLDMRMDRRSLLSAADFVNAAPAAELEQCFRDLGDERYARRIARAVAEARRQQPFSTTGQLAAVVSRAHPHWPRDSHPATRVFLALRIHVNGELAALDRVLAVLPDVLRPGGRAIVISFHSGEDRRVKQAFRGAPVDGRTARLPPLPAAPRRMRACGRPRRPTAAEVDANPRARSAVLRVGERVA